MSLVALKLPVNMSSSSGLPSPPSSKENWTITCYSCGMPSSSVWAKLVRCRPDTGSASTPYYPNLLDLPCPNGAVLSDDGSTHLCAFCFASLESQWNNYEKQAEPLVHPKDRKYNLQKFVCAVCGVETYRKRIRALPFQEFPFLNKDRQPGSLTLGQNPLAIVCLDCSETLWAQSAEYERWGLPIQKRHFNWMARPPPPENSMEATVARLPSGETQLPRCPPIEPSVAKGRPHLYSELIGVTVQSSQAQMDTKSNGSKVDYNRRSFCKTVNSATSRKSSAPCLSSAEHAQFPPVVTVAPMSSYRDSVSVRQGSSSVPPLAAELFKADSNHSNSNTNSNSNSADPLPPNLGLHFPVSRPVPSFLDSPAYKALQWHPRDFASFSPLETSQTNPWPWVPATPAHPQATDFVNYQSYLASLANRSFAAAESYIPPSPSIFSGSLPPSSHNHVGLSTAAYPSFHSPTPVHENGHYPRPSAVNSSATYIAPPNGLLATANTSKTSFTADPGKFQAVKRKASPPSSCESPAKIRSPNSSSTNGESQTNPNSYGSNSNSNGFHNGQAQTSNGPSKEPINFSNHPFKKRWNGAQIHSSQSNDDQAVDLRKKSVSPPSDGSGSTRPRSQSFSVAFLCNNNTLSPPEPRTRSTTIPRSPNARRDSVIIMPAAPTNAPPELVIPTEAVAISTKLETISEHIEQNASNGESTENVALKMSDCEVKEFVDRAKAAYRLEESQRKLAQKMDDELKQDFLKPLNLITTKQASELELKKTISRAEKRTLAPIQLRPETPKEEMEALLQKEIRRALADKKFSNLESPKNPEQQNFLGNLGLKVASQNEKLKIEQQWCLTLLEKLLRVSRNGNSDKKWSAEELSKLVAELANICKVESANGNGIQHNEPFTNLSLILSPEAEDLLTKQWMFNSSDLLSIVNSCGPSVKEVYIQADGEEAGSKMAIISPVISYPRYIPSYASSVASDDNLKIEEPEQRGSILSIPNVTRNSYPELELEPPTISIPEPEEIEVVPDHASATNVTVPTISIPKVPLLRRSSSESTHCENQNPERNPKPKRIQRKDSSEGKLVQVNTNTGIVSKAAAAAANPVKQTQTPNAEDIIERYGGLMKCLRNDVDSLLSSAISVKEDKHGTDNHTMDQIKNLRSALATYQTDMKVIERKLRKGEKEILRSRRPNGAVGNTHTAQVQNATPKLPKSNSELESRSKTNVFA